MEINAGENSRVMYVLSNYLPGMVIGSVINGESASGPVVGAVPEPGTLLLLAIGGLTALAAACFRRRR